MTFDAGDWKTEKGRNIVGAGLIILVTFLLYLPALQSDFVWDDDAFLTNNHLMKAEDGLQKFWASTEPPDYFPLTSSMLWFEWQMWGMDATGYHVINVILHIISSLLLWLVLKQLKIPGAWLAAFVFAVHPVNVEAVAWITQRKSTLPMVFYLMSILFFLKYDENGSKKFYGLSLLAFPLALLAKTSVVMLPFSLFFCVWWRRRKITRQDIIRVLPYFAIALVLGLVTVWFQYNRSIGDDIVRTDSFVARLAGVGWVIWFYLYKIFVPLKLVFVYPRWEIDPTRLLSWIPNLGLLATFGLFWWQRNRWGTPFLLALGYFVVTLFPMLGFLNIYYFRYSLVADHYQYQSIVGIIALAVGGGAFLAGRYGDDVKKWVVCAAGVAVCLFSLQTYAQSHIYKDVETIFLDTVEKNPNSWMPRYNLGHYYQRQKNYDKAVEYYMSGIKVQPDNPDPHNNLGNLYLEKKQYQLSLEHFGKALALDPDFAVTHYNLGTALMEMQRYPEAIRHFYKALETMRGKYRKAKAHNNLANALATLGRNHQAMAHYRKALQINPEFAEAKRNMEIVNRRLGKNA